MSDSDSFINEVTEEVRRDRLYGLVRKWGWVAALVVVGIVGGAAYLEYHRSQQAATSQAFGDALLTGLDRPESDARLAALNAIDPATPEAAMILSFLVSGEQATSGNPDGAAAALRQAAETPDIDRRYRDLALLRAEMLAPSDPAEARLILETLAEPGAPYAGLAQEQLALLALREGDVEGALELFRRIEAGAQTTPALQQRVSQLIVAIEAGAVLLDEAPDIAVDDEEAPVDDSDAETETSPAAQETTEDAAETE